MADLRVLVQKTVTSLHAGVYHATKGRIGGTFAKAPILLLDTVGRRSGQHRTTPLVYAPDGDRWVIIASNGGAPRHPDWLLNLRADPHAEIEVEGRRIPVRAEIVEGDERDGLWNLALGVYGGYDGYQAKTDRLIPVVVLSRR